MNLKPLYDCVLVSAFGRSELLGLELAQRGFRVAILDLSESFTRLGVHLRDVEGPFPMITPTPSLPSHLDWMIAHSSGELDRGFSVWLKSGPIEMRGPLSGFYADRDAAVSNLKDYLGKKIQQGSSRLFRRHYATLSFEDSWMIHLAHSLAQLEMLMHKQCAFYGEPFPLHQASQLLRWSDSALADLKGSAIHAGVDYLEEDIVGVETEGKVMKSILLKNNRQLRSLFFGWSLGQEETFALSPQIFKKVFQQDVPVISDWKWQRISLETSQPHFASMPDSFLMIENPEWFWSGENFVLFKRVDDQNWDLWIRMPRNYPAPARILEKIKAYLIERIGKFDGELQWVVEGKNAPCFFPIYERGQRRGLKSPQFKNLIYEGVDQLERLDLSYRFQNQVESLSIFENLKQKHEKQALKKGGPRDQQIHAP